MDLYSIKKRELENLYNKFFDFDNYELNREKFEEFYRNGNRLNYENEYFSRRGCLTARAMYSIIENNSESDDKLEEIIDALCNEFTWALPAHVGRDTKNPQTVIDLFSAETAQALCEIAFYINIPDALHKRIHELIFERIIEPYENNSFWWEKCNMNWAAVCGGCVGMVYLYEFPERFDGVKTRLLSTIECFLAGYGDDGVCLEGLEYWGYGFGYFIYFAELLRRARNIDLLALDKVKKIAEFQHNMFLKGGISVSFSDGDRKGCFNVGLTHFLKKEFGDSIKIPNKQYRCDYDECYRWAGYLRSFIWFNSSISANQESDTGEKYFSDAQWYINKKKLYSFAAKGGNNDEPHNHNDVGSFIIADEKNQLIIDYGAGEYTADYFDNNSRYNHLCTSSAGHNLPVIDGNYQQAGKECAAKVIKASGNEFIAELASAYNVPEIKGIRRHFKLEDNRLLLSDSFECCGGSHIITERFMSLAEPELSNGDIKIGGLTIKTGILPRIIKHPIKNHSGDEEIVFSIDYEITGDEFCCAFIFCEAP